MNFCACETERQQARGFYYKMKIAQAVYLYARAVKAYYERYLAVLYNRWIENLCHGVEAAGGCCPPNWTWAQYAATLICWAISVEIEWKETQLSQQERIVDTKKGLYDDAVKAYELAEKRYIACKNRLRKCQGCEEEFKPKTDCIKMCEGCKEDYCKTCFDAGIEAYELERANA